VPPPLPADTIGYNTAEFNDSNGPRFHGAPTAWVAGATGAGEIIAVIDSGLYPGETGLAGRISSDSTGINGNTSWEADQPVPDPDLIGSHGTFVSLVAAADNDGAGTVGIAYDATILAIRADTPGTCEMEDGCTFGDIAEGIDWAVSHGATVINVSLGGAPASFAERQAIAAAADAGVIVIVSAGNEFDENEPETYEPDLLAQGFANAAPTHVIIAGSVGGQCSNPNIYCDPFTNPVAISDFSNRAEGYETQFLSALGNDVLVTIGGDTYIISGTSFAAPQIAGAVALLAQAFPSMTGAEIVDLLLSTAQDVGPVGPDSTYGMGIMDIHEAFQPQGTTTLAASTTPVNLGDTSGAGSPAMGDALGTASVSTIVLDKYRRAFRHDFGFNMRNAALSQRLHGAVGGRHRTISMAGGKVSLAFTIDNARSQTGFETIDQLRLSHEDAEMARTLAARVALQLSPTEQFGFTYAESADGLVAQMQGQERPAFFIARSAGGDDGAFRRTDVSFAFRKQMGGWGLTASAETGEMLTGAPMVFGDKRISYRPEEAVRSFGLALDRRFGAAEAAIGLSWMDEDRTVLGARFHDSFSTGGANTMFLDASAGWSIAPRWRLGASWRGGMTRAVSGALIDGSDIFSSAWSFDIERRGIFAGRDALAFRIAQPLRVESGGLRLNMPVDYDYATMSPVYGISTLSLSPGGREIMGELGWRGPLWGGWGMASLFYRREPGHFAQMPDDKGVAIRWSTDF